MAGYGDDAMPASRSGRRPSAAARLPITLQLNPFGLLASVASDSFTSHQVTMLCLRLNLEFVPKKQYVEV